MLLDPLINSSFQTRNLKKITKCYKTDMNPTKKTNQTKKENQPNKQTKKGNMEIEN